MADPILALDILGTSGLRQTGGWVIEEFLRQLRGPRGIELIKEMTWNNPQVGAIRVLIHSLVRQVKWEVQSAENPVNPDQAKLACDLIESSMQDMTHTWHDFVTEALSHIDYGFSYHEIIYKLRRGPKGPDVVRSKHNDGMWGWRKIDLRSQDTLDRWEFRQDDGTILGFWQRDSYANRYVFIPVERAIHFRTEKFKNNPEGRSIFRNAVIPYLRLKHIEDIEAIGVERDLAGMPVLEVPLELLDPGAPPEVRALRRELEKMLGQIKRDERDFVLMPGKRTIDDKPTGYDFKLLASSGQRQLDIVKIKDSYKTDILMSVLAQFLQLGTQSATGSWALADSATNLFSLSMGSILDNMEETINRQLIDPLCELNGIQEEDRPTVKHGDIETPPLEQVAAYVKAMSDTQVLEPSDKLKQKLHDIASLPYEPQVLAPGGVVPADQIVAQVLAGGDVPGSAPDTANPDAPGAVQTADQILAGALPKGHPAGGTPTADQIIERHLPKKPTA